MRVGVDKELIYWLDLNPELESLERDKNLHMCQNYTACKAKLEAHDDDDWLVSKLLHYICLSTCTYLYADLVTATVFWLSSLVMLCFEQSLAFTSNQPVSLSGLISRAAF